MRVRRWLNRPGTALVAHIALAASLVGCAGAGVWGGWTAISPSASGIALAVANGLFYFFIGCVVAGYLFWPVWLVGVLVTRRYLWPAIIGQVAYCGIAILLIAEVIAGASSTGAVAIIFAPVGAGIAGTLSGAATLAIVRTSMRIRMTFVQR